MNIFHLQSDTGEVGGISNYINAITSNKYPECNIHISVSNINEITLHKYNGSILHELPSTYSFFNFISYIQKLRKILIIYKIDVIHSHALRSGFIAIIVKTITRCRVVHTNHGIRFNQKNNFLSKIVFFLIEFFVITFANSYICITMSGFRFLNRFIIIEKIKFINTRLNVFPEVDLYQRKKLFTSNNYSCIGIGSTIPIKRIDNFLFIARELSKLSPNIAFEWYGDGFNFEFYKNLAQINNINVIWHGNKSNPDLINNLSHSTILLVTSDYEVLPLSILEAYAKGVLVISNNFNNADDFIINNVTGLVLDTTNHKESAALIYQILHDYNLYEDILLNAMSYYLNNHYNSKLMSDEYLTIYKSVCLQS